MSVSTTKASLWFNDNAYHCALDYFWNLQDHLFNRSRADAMARNIDHVVGS